jgi:hypothetical protein
MVIASTTASTSPNRSTARSDEEMTDNKGTGQPQPEDEKDVEGHNMWIDPGMQRDLSRSRSKDLERAARERNRTKDVKSK